MGKKNGFVVSEGEWIDSTPSNRVNSKLLPSISNPEFQNGLNKKLIF
ncbi:hypothetical protein N9M44_03540 [Flavobacteriaceae bacterium]|nr:hypothetical protein [Flavobacteriaceae bacterium]